ncbi:MAG TPA: porin family protein [Anditalea sp.]|nr:porin family protein [Anditalea sp.]
MVAELPAQTSIGVKAGYSSSNVTYRSRPGTPPRRTGDVLAPTYSLVIEQFFSNNAGAQLEVQWLTHGYAEQDTLGNINESRLNYLKIPLLSNFYIGNKNRFHIKMGPHFGMLLNAQDIVRTHETNDLGLAAMPMYGREADAPQRFMYGLTGGVGLSRLLGRNTIQAELRFGYEFGRPESLERVFDMNFTNLELTLSYLFAVIKRP